MSDTCNKIPIKQLTRLERQTKLYKNTTIEFKLHVTLEDFILGNWNKKTVKGYKI